MSTRRTPAVTYHSSSGRHAADAGLPMEERRRQTLALIEERGRVTTEELAEWFRTSLVTVRGDLNALAETGVIVRTHGGALAHRDGEEVPIEVKENLRHADKVRIAAAAAAMIENGDTVLLDSGSTTGEIAKQIRGMRLQSINVITNALNVAVTLAQASHVRLVMLGGVLRPNSLSFSGPQAEQVLAGLHADKLFIGVDSLDPDIGMMTPHLLEAQLNAEMIRVSREVIAVADSSKLLRRNLSVIAKVEQIHTLITDTAANADIVAALRQRGVDVVLV